MSEHVRWSPIDKGLDRNAGRGGPRPGHVRGGVAGGRRGGLGLADPRMVVPWRFSRDCPSDHQTDGRSEGRICVVWPRRCPARWWHRSRPRRRGQLAAARHAQVVRTGASGRQPADPLFRSHWVFVVHLRADRCPWGRPVWHHELCVGVVRGPPDSQWPWPGRRAHSDRVREPSHRWWIWSRGGTRRFLARRARGAVHQADESVGGRACVVRYPRRIPGIPDHAEVRRCVHERSRLARSHDQRLSAHRWRHVEGLHHRQPGPGPVPGGGRAQVGVREQARRAVR